ncbi:hypothetical protein PUN28_011580 [Cardiocondyla obscurior]|uniref:Uncharacterized protein n=1 Tax=Cardiocondyla obscurior TaxID=286306 RepID=A0AAW2FG23_9HYME
MATPVTKLPQLSSDSVHRTDDRCRMPFSNSNSGRARISERRAQTSNYPDNIANAWPTSQFHNQCEDEVETVREEASHSDRRSNNLRGGGGLGKASCYNEAATESPAEIYNSAEAHADW